MKIVAYTAILHKESPKAGRRDRSDRRLINTDDVGADAAFAARADHLRIHVKDAFAKLDELRNGSGEFPKVVNTERPLYVFVAPEWFFRVKDDQFGFDPAEFFTKAHREQFHELVKELSVREFGQPPADVLIIAGSMLWIEPHEEEKVSLLITEMTDYENSKKAKYSDATNNPRSAARIKLEENSYQARQDLASDQAKPYLGYNEALVGFNGEIVKSVQKSHNAGDFDITKGGAGNFIAMVPGLGAGTFKLDIHRAEKKLKVGLTICFDHQRIVGYGKSVNLYILISCSQSMESAVKYVLDGGLILHADCRREDVGIHDATGTQLGTNMEPYRIARSLIKLC